MSKDPLSTDTTVTSRQTLLDWLESGCKPKSLWRVGTEHEKFGFHKQDLTPISYAGKKGVRAVLEDMARRFEWQTIQENTKPIALKKGLAAITLEPGGQLELSGAPTQTIHQTQTELNEHLQQLGVVCKDLEIAFLGIGTQPKWPQSAMHWMPKGRYQVMRHYLPKKGHLSLDMMTRTATVQANLDFGSEADMIQKFRLSMALQPLATALFANSPFLEGKPNGFLSYRAEIWRHTDQDRCGWLPFLFNNTFNFERYLDYALDVPLLFLYRNGTYQDAGGATFRSFLAGKLPQLPGEYPLLSDWETHIGTLFPDVRLKHYLEVRGADVGNSATLCALPAFWKGLLYDDDAMQAAWELVEGWSLEDRARIHLEAPKLGLKTLTPNGKPLKELAIQILQWSQAGLANQNQKNSEGCDESVYLKPLFEIAQSGITPAERLLEAYHGRWNQTVDPVFSEEEFESFFAECT